MRERPILFSAPGRDRRKEDWCTTTGGSVMAAVSRMSNPERVVIKHDLENAFERDNALGDDCDRVMWEKVRAAWMREEVKEGTP